MYLRTEMLADLDGSGVMLVVRDEDAMLAVEVGVQMMALSESECESVARAGAELAVVFWRAMAGLRLWVLMMNGETNNW
jgi:hypothetical protein